MPTNNVYCAAGACTLLLIYMMWFVDLAVYRLVVKGDVLNSVVESSLRDKVLCR